MGQGFQTLPEYLAENKYVEPKDPTNAPLQKGHHTNLPAFIWVTTKPANMAHFNQWLAVQRTGMPIWLDVFLVAQRTANLRPGQPLFVDVGGGFGHQSVAFRERYPTLSGRVVVQEIPPTLAMASKQDKAERTEYDFWTPQTIKRMYCLSCFCRLVLLLFTENSPETRFYYFRNILHDYPDEGCEKILKNTMSAMSKDSAMLIDDMVIPDKDAHWHSTQLDIAMLTRWPRRNGLRRMAPII